MNQKRNPVRRSASSRNATNIDNRVRDIQIQSALNFLGFDAGFPDGVIGPGARAAIRQYQEKIGQQETGVLTLQEFAALLSVHLELVGGAILAKPAGKLEIGEVAGKLSNRFRAFDFAKAADTGSAIKSPSGGPLVPSPAVPAPTDLPAQRSPAPPRSP